MGSRAEKQVFLEKKAQVDTHWIYQGKFISIRRDEIDFPDGSHKTWDIIVHPGAVAVVPVTREGKIIFVEQFRRAVGQITLEIPAGVLDAGETAEACAQRELQEEIGYKAAKLISLGSYFSSPGVFTEKVHLFIAKELSESQLIAEDTQDIDIRIISLKTALQFIDDGTICDAKTALAILKVGL